VSEVSMTGLDLAKHVFQAHGADASGKVVFRKRLRRGRVLEFFAGKPACVVAMEACSSAHHWARELARLGHIVRLIPPAYVKPFAKRQKNDTADAEAICEAAQRPTMRFVAVKSEAAQANAVVFRARDLLVRQRTQAINALRGHLGEYGLVVAKGPGHIVKLVDHVEDPNSDVPEAARLALRTLVDALRFLSERIDLLDREIARRAREDDEVRRLTSIPGVGPIRHGARCIGSARGCVQERSGLRGLGGAHALTALYRRQAEAWHHLENGRANAAAAPDHRSEFGGAQGGQAGHCSRVLARADAGSQTQNARHRGAREQDGPYRVGRAG
jgi:transposase